LQPSTWRPEPLIEVVEIETRVEGEADNSTNFLLCLSKPDWLLLLCRAIYLIEYVNQIQELTERSVVALLDAPIASSKVTASGSNSCQKTHIGCTKSETCLP